MIKALAVGALALTLASGVADSKCSNEGPGAPAPQPDPVPKRTGNIGNVRITFWLDQDQHRTVTTYNIGTRKHICDDSCHWSETAKPNQQISVTSDYYDIGQRGWLFIQVIQDNNGRILCEDRNDDDRGRNVACDGTVVI